MAHLQRDRDKKHRELIKTLRILIWIFCLMVAVGTDPTNAQRPVIRQDQVSPRTYQAEHAVMSGGSKIEFNHSGFNGSGFVNLPKDKGLVEWTNVQVGTGGPAMIAFRYALGASTARTAKLVVNTATRTVTFEPTGSWSTWNHVYVRVHLRGGIDNTIIVRSDGEDSGNIDELAISGPAEDAEIGGGSQVESNHVGFNGDGFVNFPQDGGFVEWSHIDGGDVGTANLAFRYALGADESRTCDLIVNGQAGPITFQPTGGWNQWQTVNEVIELNRGIQHTVRVESMGEDCGNIDELFVTHIIGTQAEDAEVGGDAQVESNHMGFRGNGFVNFPKDGGFVEWSHIDGGDVGTANLTFRYALEADESRTCDLIVNGQAGPITFQPTGGWNQWQIVDEVVELNRGINNTVRIKSTGADCGNVDELFVIPMESTASPTTSLSVMSFNIRFDYLIQSAEPDVWDSSSGISRRDLALRVINQVEPDILGVQEAVPQQVDDLVAGLPGYDFYGVGRDDGESSGEYAGIFYRAGRFAQIDNGTFWLSQTPEIPSLFDDGDDDATNNICCKRIASWVRLEDRQAPNRQYFILNTHWDHVKQDARLLSAKVIREQIKSLAGNTPLIVMGDLNAVEDNEAYLSLIGLDDRNGFQLLDSYRDVFPVQQSEEKTFHGFKGDTRGSRIDFILYSNFFRAEDAAIVTTRFGGQYPSDHYPVTALFVAR